LYLVFLSFYTLLIHHHFVSYLCFLVIIFKFFLFFFTLFFRKKYYFLFFILRIFITIHLAYLYHYFCSYLHSFIICLIIFSIFVLYTFCFSKNSYTKTKEIMFQCRNCNIVPFFYYIKNKLQILYIFINIYDFHYILLYISIDFFLFTVIFFSRCQKNMLITPTY